MLFHLTLGFLLFLLRNSLFTRITGPKISQNLLNCNLLCRIFYIFKICTLKKFIFSSTYLLCTNNATHATKKGNAFEKESILKWKCSPWTQSSLITEYKIRGEVLKSDVVTLTNVSHMYFLFTDVRRHVGRWPTSQRNPYSSLNLPTAHGFVGHTGELTETVSYDKYHTFGMKLNHCDPKGGDWILTSIVHSAETLQPFPSKLYFRGRPTLFRIQFSLSVRKHFLTSSMCYAPDGRTSSWCYSSPFDIKPHTWADDV